MLLKNLYQPLTALLKSAALLFFPWACSSLAQPPDKPALKHSGLDAKLSHLLRFSVPLMSVDTLHARSADVYLFDVREEAEYQISHIPGARYLGYKDFHPDKLRAVPKDACIVLYCSVGYRSEKIGERLMEEGYTQVFNLYGSIFEWADRGYPLWNKARETTFQLHTYNKQWAKWIKEKEIEKFW